MCFDRMRVIAKIWMKISNEKLLLSNLLFFWFLNRFELYNRHEWMLRFDQIQINANLSTVIVSTTCALIYLAHSIKGNCCGFEPVCPLCTPSVLYTWATATFQTNYRRTHKNVNDIQTVIFDDAVRSSFSAVLLCFALFCWSDLVRCLLPSDEI